MALSISRIFKQMREIRVLAAERAATKVTILIATSPKHISTKRTRRRPRSMRKPQYLLETSDYDREQNVNFIDTAMVSIFPALDSNKC